MSCNKRDQEAKVSRQNFVARLSELFNEALETNWKFPEPEAEFTTEKEKNGILSRTTKRTAFWSDRIISNSRYKFCCTRFSSSGNRWQIDRKRINPPLRMYFIYTLFSSFQYVSIPFKGNIHISQMMLAIVCITVKIYRYYQITTIIRYKITKRLIKSKWVINTWCTTI